MKVEANGDKNHADILSDVLYQQSINLTDFIMSLYNILTCSFRYEWVLLQQINISVQLAASITLLQV